MRQQATRKETASAPYYDVGTSPHAQGRASDVEAQVEPVPLAGKTISAVLFSLGFAVLNNLLSWLMGVMFISYEDRFEPPPFWFGPIYLFAFYASIPLACFVYGVVRKDRIAALINTATSILFLMLFASIISYNMSHHSDSRPFSDSVQHTASLFRYTIVATIILGVIAGYVGERFAKRKSRQQR